MEADYKYDPRAVMTLDAGGTNFGFCAIKGYRPAVPSFSVPSHADNLEKCLDTLVSGFQRVWDSLPSAPSAISFAFPGPADYRRGIIGDLANLPCFRGGIALGPMLEEIFKVPVFINNDGDLFAYGEATAGFLPWVNGLLAEAGSRKRFRNLFGVTLGTGLGGGIVQNGMLFAGDNICAGEIWLFRNKRDHDYSAEENASIRGVRRTYAKEAGLFLDEAPEPKTIFEIAQGVSPGNLPAAKEAFRRLGEIVGDTLAQAMTMIDGLAVIGGGLSGAWPFFLPAMVEEMNSYYKTPEGGLIRRLAQTTFNLEEKTQLESFLEGDRREAAIPGFGRKVAYDALPRIGVGISKLGTNEAVAIGAYAFALRKLDGDSQEEVRQFEFRGKASPRPLHSVIVTPEP